MLRTLKSLAARVSAVLSGCVMPTIPAIIAGSLLKLVHLLMSFAHLSDTTTGHLIEIFGDVPFYFLPVLVSYCAADYFHTHHIHAVSAACVLLAPDFMALMTGTEAVTLFGLPVIKNNYAYNIVPVILTVYALSLIAPRLEARFPEALRGNVCPFVIFGITVILEVLVLAPLGSLIGQGLSAAFAFLSAHAAVPAWGLFAALLAIMVPTGVHWIFETAVFNDLAVNGQDSGVMASFLIMVMALAGTDLAYALRCKNGKDRAVYIGYGLSALLTGVSEPSLFAIALRDPKVMRAILIASFLPGMYQGFVGIPCYIYSFPALPSILMFYSADNPSNVIHALIVLVMALVLGFVLTFFFCKDPVPAQISGN